jgi:hypothetical protein
MPPTAIAVIVLALGAVVVALMPDVNGTFVALLTPAKATACVLAVTTGEAVEFEGLRTLFFVNTFLNYKGRGGEERNEGGGDILVNDMHDAVRNNDISDSNLRGVDKDFLVYALDSDSFAAENSGQRLVREAGGEERGVADCAGYNVVFEDAGELIGGQGAGC